MSERGWGRVWPGHSLPAGTAPSVPSACRGGEEKEEEEDVAAAAAPPAPRCAARLRGCRSAAAPAPAGQRLPAALSGGAQGSLFPCPAETFPRAVGSRAGRPRQSLLPCPVPRACGERGERDVAQGVFPQPHFPETALCPPRSRPGSGEQPSGKFSPG